MTTITARSTHSSELMRRGSGTGEAFHTRKLVLEYRADGARLVRDEALRTFGRSARLLSKFPTRRRARKA